MFRGLFHKQGVGGFTSESAEAENSSLKPNYWANALALSLKISFFDSLDLL
jgi:hypothetical protein